MVLGLLFTQADDIFAEAQKSSLRVVHSDLLYFLKVFEINSTSNLHFGLTAHINHTY